MRTSTTYQQKSFPVDSFLYPITSFLSTKNDMLLVVRNVLPNVCIVSLVNVI